MEVKIIVQTEGEGGNQTEPFGRLIFGRLGCDPLEIGLCLIVLTSKYMSLFFVRYSLIFLRFVSALVRKWGKRTIKKQ